ncbi:MAG: ribose-phosphate pyrophosphokinase, partial [Patescibacteria group bacterium]|nr:ribose-phosphate pyrophosphokinase [Patescibacteria group bacterium]
ALKRSGAEFVTAVVPYLGYQRQDHIFREGEAVSLEVIVKTLESVGMDRIISVDLHTPKIPDVFSIPMTHLSALPLFARKIKELGGFEHSVLVSPDMGGIRRIKMLSEMLNGMPYVAIEKNRDLSTGIVTAHKFGEGSINGAKRAFIVDDMVASGKTIVTAAHVLLNAGVEEMYVFATHAIFAKEAPEILETSVAKKLFVTDSVYIPQDKVFPKLELISIAGIIAEAIKNK